MYDRIDQAEIDQLADDLDATPETETITTEDDNESAGVHDDNDSDDDNATTDDGDYSYWNCKALH